MSEDARAQMQAVLDALGFQGDPEMVKTAERFTTFLGSWRPEGGRPDLSVCASSMPGQAIAVREIPFHSLCAHHLLPFFGTVSVAYRAGDSLAGFGAIPRVVRWAATRPQLQERLANQVVQALVDGLAPQGVLLRIEARHMCVEMRGARSAAEIVVEASSGETEGLRELMRED